MIEVKQLVKDWPGGVRAVDHVTFSVPRGQVLGFLGPNGAGKSTTMKILTGFIAPSSGTATVDGFDINRDPIAVKSRIGYLPESAPSYGEMTVCEFLNFIAELRGFRGKARIVAAEKMRETCFLWAVWHQVIETLSKGYRQRVGFAQALIHDPPVLVLDEPTDGLDPNQKHEVRQLIRRMGTSKTIILSTHILEEVESVCHRAIIIAGGKIVADSTPAGLMAGSSLHNAVTMTVSTDDLQRAKSMLASIGEVSLVDELEGRPGTLRIFSRDGRPIVSVVSQVVRERNLSVQQIHVEQGRLDEVFRKVTSVRGNLGSSASSANSSSRQSSQGGH